MRYAPLSLSSPMTPIWIAELRAIIVHPDGRRVPGHIAVGQPYSPAGTDPEANASRCPVEITSLHSGSRPIIGDGTLQALLLGVRFLGTMLHEFVGRGGRVLYADENADAAGDVDVPLAAFFGPLLLAADAFD
jgi:hypothetical protein